MLGSLCQVFHSLKLTPQPTRFCTSLWEAMALVDTSATGQVRFGSPVDAYPKCSLPIDRACSGVATKFERGIRRGNSHSHALECLRPASASPLPAIPA